MSCDFRERVALVWLQCLGLRNDITVSCSSRAYDQVHTDAGSCSAVVDCCELVDDRGNSVSCVLSRLRRFSGLRRDDIFYTDAHNYSSRIK